jgi:dihydrofolate synthase/folylpolyglutamate synthase
MNKEPLVIADVAHNFDGIQAVLEQLRKIPTPAYHFVIGMSGDKDVHKILDLFPKQATYYFCRANVPRAMDDQELQELALEKGLIGEFYGSVKSAVQAAMLQARKKDVIFIGGSIFVVAEAI